jgi:hypothetical protein
LVTQDPLSFVIFTDYIYKVVIQITVIKIFVDDTRLGRRITTGEDKQKLQEALEALCKWSQRWKTEVNVSECEVMNLGHKNPRHEYGT